MLQRDAFIEEITTALAKEKDIYFLSADFGAAALDDLRVKFPENFIHCGISEQAMLDVATGLALDGKRVFCYAMAPFLSLRALEQIKCGPGMMNLPICLISVGIGLGYADAGPTHYITEDFACLRSIIGSSIYTVSDEETSRRLVLDLLQKPKFAYVRLDRHEQPKLEVHARETNLDFRIIGDADDDKIVLIGSGKMAHIVSSAQKERPSSFMGIDLIRAKPFPNDLVPYLKASKGVIVIDEQTPSGALGSAVMEACSANAIVKKICQITIPEMYIFENGGREHLLNKLGLSKEGILKLADTF